MDLSPRLSRIVDSALQYRITEVVAPAGFGKTTVLNEITSKRGFLLAPIRPHSDPVMALMRALCQAVSEDFPHLSRALPEAFENASGAIADLNVWFSQSIGDQKYKFAIDDLHHLQDDESATKLLCSIVETTCEQGFQWVVTSRTWPRLPTVEWTAKGDEGPSIRESDLLLSASDLEHFAESMQIRLSNDSANQITAATRGWPLLSIYAGRLVQQGRSLKDVLDATRGRGIGAIADQFLTTIDEDEYRLLLVIVLLDGALPEDLEIVQAGGAKSVVRLAIGGIPLSQGIDRRWRLHDALRDYFLTNSVIDASKVDRAALAFEDYRKFDHALRIAVVANATETMRNVLERHPHHFADADDPSLLRGALAALSHRTVHASPQLCLIRGIDELVRGDASIAVDFLHRAVDLGDENLRTYAKARRLLGFMDSPGHIDQAREAMAELAEASIPSNDEQACEVLSILATALSAFGDKDRARRTIEQAMNLLGGISNPRIEARTYLRAAQVALRASSPNDVKVYTERAIELGERFGFFVTLFLAVRLRLMALAPVNESQAIDCARKGLKFAKQILSSRYVYASETSLFAFACRSGDLDEARSLRRRLLPIPGELKARLGGTVSTIAAQLALLEGNYWEAATLLADVRGFGKPELDGAVVDAREIVFHAQSALVNHLTESCDAAISAAQNALSASSQFSRDGLAVAAIPEVEISRITAAAILGANGRMSEAEEVLKDLADSAHEEYRRDLARWAYALLVNAETEPSESAMHFAKGVVELIRRSVVRTQQGSLTPAERRVLESLALGRSNKEIAAITGKSVKTVDNQVSAILKKLQARSRGEAVARARSTGALRA